MVTSQVTEAGRGSAEWLIVVTDSEIDLDTSIKVCNSMDSIHGNSVSSESCGGF